MESYLGQIIAVGFNYAPPGWAPCDGRLLQIAQYSALYAVLGTFYGGDGRSNFAVPDLRGRTLVCIGQGSGTSNYMIGQTNGAENVTLSVAQIPAHNHLFIADATDGTTSSPSGGNIAQTNDGNGVNYPSFTTGAPTAPSALNNPSVQNTGGGGSFSVLQPLLAINYIIALQGIYPSRP